MKQLLLEASKLRTETIVLEGQKVTLREIGTVEFAQYGSISNDETDDKGAVVKKGDKLKATAFLISVSVVDAETGEALFTEEEALSLAKLARMASPIMNKVMDLSGFGKEGSAKHSDAS